MGNKNATMAQSLCDSDEEVFDKKAQDQLLNNISPTGIAPKELMRLSGCNAVEAIDFSFTCRKHMYKKKVKQIVITPSNTSFYIDERGYVCMTMANYTHKTVLARKTMQIVYASHQSTLLALTEDNNLFQSRETPHNIEENIKWDPMLEKETVIKVHGGYCFCIIQTSTDWYGFGDSSVSQLPIGDYYTPAPVRTLSSFSIESIHCGGYHTIFKTTKGEYWGFGFNSAGRLGFKTDSDDQREPVQLRFLEKLNIVTITCGRWHTVALTVDGIVYTWGAGDNDGCGFRDGRNKPSVLKFPEKMARIFSDSTCCHNFAIARNGDLYGFGDNGHGQLGAKRDLNVVLVCKAVDLGFVETICLSERFTCLILRSTPALVIKRIGYFDVDFITQ